MALRLQNCTDEARNKDLTETRKLGGEERSGVISFSHNFYEKFIGNILSRRFSRQRLHF